VAHKVTFALPERELGSADILVLVKRNGARFGKLLISKGAVVWRPRSKQREMKLSWKAFDETMRQEGGPE